jgi:hypothetical protein
MAAALQTSFAGLRLGAPVQKRNTFISNGNAQKLAMKAKHTFQVEVGDEFRTAAYLNKGCYCGLGSNAEPYYLPTII